MSNKVEKFLWIALGALPIPLVFTIFALVAGHNAFATVMFGIAGWALAFAIAMLTQISFDKNLESVYPRTEYITVGLMWFVTGFMALCMFLMDTDFLGPIRKFFSSKFWKKEI